MGRKRRRKKTPNTQPIIVPPAHPSSQRSGSRRSDSDLIDLIERTLGGACTCILAVTLVALLASASGQSAVLENKPFDWFVLVLLIVAVGCALLGHYLAGWPLAVGLPLVIVGLIGGIAGAAGCLEP
jgi:hypothetical protein